MLWIAALLGHRGRIAARQLALALLLPGICIAVWPEALPSSLPGSLHAHASPRLPVLILACLPLLLLPVLSRLARVPDGLNRAASGLGAGRAAIIRLVWLPLLGPSGLLGIVLVGLLDLSVGGSHA